MSEKNIQVRDGEFIQGGVMGLASAGVTTLEKGHIAMSGPDGKIEPGADKAGGYRVIGIAEETAEPSFSAEVQNTVNVRRNKAFLLRNSDTNPITISNSIAYLEDSETVCASAGSTNDIAVGLVVGLQGDSVWVEIENRSDHDAGGGSTKSITVKDSQTIQAAIDGITDAAVDNRYLIIVPPGLWEEHDITIPSYISIQLQSGAILRNTVTDTDVCIFKNADQVNGNTEIYIYGEGILQGCAWNWTAGEQVGVNFKKVTNGKVECYIDDFSHLEVKRNNCINVFVKNLSYERMDRQPVKAFHFSSDWATEYGLIFSGPDVTYNYESSGGPTGGSCLKVNIPKDKYLNITNSFWRNNNISLDLRFSKVTFWIKLEGTYSDADIKEITYLTHLIGYSPLTSTPASCDSFFIRSREWVKVTQYWGKSSYYEIVSSVDKLLFQISTSHTGSLPGPFEVWIADIQIEPLINRQQCCVGFSFDDGHPTWKDISLILEEYGMRGNFNIFIPERAETTYNGGTNYSDNLPLFKKIANAGHEIASHSLTHNVKQDNIIHELYGSKRRLQADGLGQIKFFVTPGGSSSWSGEMWAEVEKYYSGGRIGTSGFIGASRKLEFGTFAVVDAKGTTGITDQQKREICNYLIEHIPVLLYLHRFDATLNETQLRSICDFLQEIGVDILTYSEMFPDSPDVEASIVNEPYGREISAGASNLSIYYEDGDLMVDPEGANIDIIPCEHYPAFTKINIINTADADETLTFDPLFTSSGAHDGADNADMLTDSGESWIAGQLVGRTINNTTDGSSGVITANTTTTITAELSGGTDNDWDIGDTYTITPVGSNQSIAQNETKTFIYDGEGWHQG